MNKEIATAGHLYSLSGNNVRQQQCVAILVRQFCTQGLSILSCAAKHML
jgi:hypothetical protein